MKVRKAIKKLVALGTGAVMMGATIVGAMAAADLSDYPAPFIKNGEFDGLIVVGENAASSDVVGAIDIAFSLQYGAKTSTTLNTGGAVGTTTVSGDAAKVKGGSDFLELTEVLGDVKETFSAADLNALASGLISTDEGTTDYNQYLRFSSGTTDFPGNVLYSENEDEEVGDFLFWADGDTIFEYELEFEEGLESDVDSNNDLADIEDETLVILGKTFNVVQTDISVAADTVELVMLGGDVTDTLVEGETKTYTIDGQDYEVKLLIVADTTQTVKFVVNGEVSDKLTEGETDTLSDGTLIGIRDVLPNEGEEEEGGDIVEFYLGASKLEWSDTNYTESTFGGTTEVNDESIEDGSLIISMSELSSSKVEINSIRYRLHADSNKGDVFVKAGQGVREFLDEPEGMISMNWDIEYEGLTDPSGSYVEIRSNGDEEYDLHFTNLEGLDYKVPLIDNSNNDGFGFKYGDEDDDLWFQEPLSFGSQLTNATASMTAHGFWISEDDYFLLGDVNDEDGVFSHVLRYESIDTSNRELQFTDLAGGQKEVTYDAGTLTDTSSTQTGDLIVGGKTYTVWVSSLVGNPLAIDLDQSGTINGGKSKVAVEGSLILDLGFNINATLLSDSMNTSVQTGGTDNGNVSQLEFGQVANAALLNFTVETDDFDESSHGEETVTVNITAQSNNEVDLSIVTGVTMHSLDDEDLKRGMTDFGMLFEETDDDQSTDADDLKVWVPSEQREAQVYVTFGETTTATTSSAGGGSIEVTNLERINVGAAQLDKDVSDVWAQNLIVVGGPCANEAAREVMGVSAGECASGFEEGKAMLKLYENRGKVALLVAGYSALDTRRGARVVADYDKYMDDLVGSEVVVSGTTLKDISVSQPAPKAAEPAEEPAEEAEEPAEESEEAEA